MADATYEVGQVVAHNDAMFTDLIGSKQFAIVGRHPGGGNPIRVFNELIYILSAADIRPLAPGEEPTIDSRGYPIGEKGGRHDRRP